MSLVATTGATYATRFTATAAATADPGSREIVRQQINPLVSVYSMASGRAPRARRSENAVYVA